jgi:hypothetical protein
MSTSRSNRSTSKDTVSSSLSHNVSLLQSIAENTPSNGVLPAAERRARHAARRKATAEFLTLILAMARGADGSVAGVALTPDESEEKLAQAKLFFAGAQVALSLYLTMLSEGVTAYSDVAQRALNALKALEVQAAGPDGAKLAAKVRDLRAVLGGQRRRGKKSATPVATSPVTPPATK